MKLTSVAVVGFALVAMGCQAPAPLPPQAPQGGAMAAPPAPPPGGGPQMMAHHPEGPGGPGAYHEGGGALQHHRDADDKRMARREQGKHMGRMEPGGGHMGPGGGQEAMRELAELGVHFYPPPMLIRRAQEIGLTPDQVTKIRQEMLSTQAHAVDLHAKLEHAKIEVTRLLSAEKVDERAVNAQIDEAAKVQAEMHKLHVGAMLRVRALLTPEQRQKLEVRKPKQGPRPGAGGVGPTSGAIGEADDDDDDDDDDDADS